MMKNLIFGIIILAFLLPFPLASVRAGAPAVDNYRPISGLIGDWQQFRASLLSKTQKYNQDDVINNKRLSRLSDRLIGSWQMQEQQADGYRLRTVLQLQRNHRFSYHHRIMSAADQDTWKFSGRWELRNHILMLLIDKSNYPGRTPHQILFWRLLRLDNSKLVYVRTGSDKLSTLTR